MRKIIIIDDSIFWINKIQTICDSLKLDCFPSKNEDVISDFRGAFRDALDNDSDSQENAKAYIYKCLHEFIEAETDIIFIIDYELFEGNPEINGLNFYKAFAEEQKTIFMSGTRNKNEIEKIEHFCRLNSQCSFLSKREADFAMQLINALNP